MKKTGIILLLLTVVGLLLGATVYSLINRYLDLGTVYIANEEIAAHTVMEKDLFHTQKRPKNSIPADAIQNEDQLKELSGRITRTLIVKDQTLQTALISDAHNVREINQNMSEDYVTVTIPLDANDTPISVIHALDVVSLVGISKKSGDEGEVIEASYAAENVLVLETVVDQSSNTGKILVLVPRDQAPEIRKNITTGKISVVIDPRKFELKGQSVK